MAQNPFDDEDGLFYALINHEEQHSLWPVFKPVPGGWSIVYGEPEGKPRQEVLDWIEEHWTDLRPKSLRDAIAAYEAGAARNAGEDDPASGHEASGADEPAGVRGAAEAGGSAGVRDSAGTDGPADVRGAAGTNGSAGEGTPA